MTGPRTKPLPSVLRTDDPNAAEEARAFQSLQEENEILIEEDLRLEARAAADSHSFAWPADRREREWDRMERAEDLGLYGDWGFVY